MDRTYVAIIEGDEERGYGLFFPAIPGCVSAGDSLAEVMQSGQEALSFHLEGMLADGERLPEQHDLTDRDLKDVERPYRIKQLSYRPVPKLKRVNVTLPEDLLNDIAEVTRNRSAFLSDAARYVLERRQSSES